MALQKKDVLAAIATVQVQLPRMLLGGQDGEHLSKLGDLHHGFVALECARHRNLQILLREELGGHVSQLVELNFLLL